MFFFSNKHSVKPEKNVYISIYLYTYTLRIYLVYSFTYSSTYIPFIYLSTELFNMPFESWRPSDHHPTTPYQVEILS